MTIKNLGVRLELIMEPPDAPLSAEPPRQGEKQDGKGPPDPSPWACREGGAQETRSPSRILNKNNSKGLFISNHN